MKILKPTKFGVTFPVSPEWELAVSHFPKRGHLETIPLTREDREAHARARAAYEECMSNPWIELSGYEYEFEVRPLQPRQVFVAEETDEEHMQRWIDAGCPVTNPLADAIDRSILDSMSRALDV
jgi:hypothetical protein